MDARVKDFLEQSFATSVSSEGINVVDVHDQANEIDLKAVNKAYVTFSQGLFVEMRLGRILIAPGETLLLSQFPTWKTR